jgi:hypothetical protein
VSKAKTEDVKALKAELAKAKENELALQQVAIQKQTRINELAGQLAKVRFDFLQAERAITDELRGLLS